MRGRYAPLIGGRYSPLRGGRYAPPIGGRYAPLMRGRYAPLMRALCPMGEVHMRACVRSFGAVASTTLETKHREVHSPEGVNWGHLLTLRSKFAEVHSPEGVNLTCFCKKKV